MVCLSLISYKSLDGEETDGIQLIKQWELIICIGLCSRKPHTNWNMVICCIFIFIPSSSL